MGSDLDLVLNVYTRLISLISLNYSINLTIIPTLKYVFESGCLNVPFINQNVSMDLSSFFAKFKVEGNAFYMSKVLLVLQSQILWDPELCHLC